MLVERTPYWESNLDDNSPRRRSSDGGSRAEVGSVYGGDAAVMRDGGENPGRGRVVRPKRRERERRDF